MNNPGYQLSSNTLHLVIPLMRLVQTVFFISQANVLFLFATM